MGDTVGKEGTGREGKGGWEDIGGWVGAYGQDSSTK